MKKYGMSKAFAALLALALAFAAVGCQKAENKLEAIQKTGKLVVATSPDFAPLEFIDLNKTGQDSYVGADIELARYIAEQLGVELEIQAMDFSAVQAAVTSGDVDLGISGFAYTDERAESMELSDYYNVEDDSGQGILILSANAASFAKSEDFTGKKVAAQNASLQYNLVTEQLPGATVELITNLNDAVLMLIAGKVDAVAVSGDNGAAFVANYPELQMSDFWFDYQAEGTVVIATKGQAALIAKVNEILAQVNASGIYQTWLDDATALAAELGLG